MALGTNFEVSKYCWIISPCERPASSVALAANGVGAVAAHGAERVVLAAINRERKSAAPGGYGIHNPAVQNRARETIDLTLGSSHTFENLKLWRMSSSDGP